MSYQLSLEVLLEMKSFDGYMDPDSAASTECSATRPSYSKVLMRESSTTDQTNCYQLHSVYCVLRSVFVPGSVRRGPVVMAEMTRRVST